MIQSLPGQRARGRVITARGNRSGAQTRLARDAPQRISIVALETLVTVVATCVIATIDTNPSLRITGFRSPITFARLAVSWSSSEAGLTAVAFVAVNVFDARAFAAGVTELVLRSRSVAVASLKREQGHQKFV